MLSKLVSYSGLASILGGILFGSAVVFHPLRDGINVLNSGNAYLAIHILGVYGLMFQLFGLLGLYIREIDVMGRRGLMSFVVLFFGQALFMCVQMVDGVLNPLLAKTAPQLVHSTADADPTLLLFALPGLGLFFVGYIVFGVSLLRAKVQPRWGSLLITIGGPVYIIGGLSLSVFGANSPIVSLIEIAGAIPLGLGYILLGLQLRSTAAIQGSKAGASMLA